MKIISLLFFAAALSLRAEQSVEQWGVFEVALNGPTNGNPFTDVQFSARFYQGTNSVEAGGFYDGNGIYRVRFMPQRQGAWHYLTESTRPELNGEAGDLTVTRPAPDNHGPVEVTNTYHFAYADGTPYEELGTTSYNWIDQTAAMQEQTLHSLETGPFNKLRMCVFPNDWKTNGVVLYPYESTGPSNWDYARFNPQFFQHLERRILDLQKIGVQADVIFFNPYGHIGFERMHADKDDLYARYLVARLAAYRNVWWSLANEWDLMKKKKESDFVRLGEIVSTNDPYHHLLSIHNSEKIFNNSLPWITHASIQNGSAVESPVSAELYRDVYRKPVVYDEVKYEGNFSKRWGQLTGQELVDRFWNGTVAGTYVGHGETFSNYTNVWTDGGGVLHGQSPARLAFLKKVLDDAPPEGIEPIDKWQNPEYGGQPGKYYLVYLGKQTMRSWPFLLPKASFGNGPAPANGMKFTAEILDTWNMTVTPVRGVFTLQRKSDYFFADKDGRAIRLPHRPYMAIRIKRVQE
ncbi:MAG TPA: DUF5060 domain-containing protein [Verrucomicrobiae bacterium]